MRDIMAFRLAGWDTPFWANPNRSAGRYNQAMSQPTQYLCLHPWGPWAEYLRREDLRDVGMLDDLRACIWVARLSVESLPLDRSLQRGAMPDQAYLDLTFENAAAHGLSAAALVADDHTACRRFADRCWSNPTGPRMLCVPNAALPATRNIVIFGARLKADWDLVRWDADLDIPTAVAADGARPAPDVVAATRYRGQPHAEYEAWRRRRGASR
ncbi:MAG TPA: hypothetical protein VG245_11230 [Candidatus Dormibacteraeota bacterium]|jgi:hypothetical protein|nr:hypothetical protein [Candidatus Dormibacteraeota bacterium]